MAESTVSTITSYYSEIEKVIKRREVLVGGVLLASGALYWICGPSKHEKIPNLDVPWSPITGHFGWIDEGAAKYCFQERIRDAIMSSKSYQKCMNLSLPLNDCTIATTDPKIIEYVFETDFESFEKGDIVREQWIEVLGEGIFMSDPPKWKLHRKAAARMFSMRNLKQHMFECAVNSSKQTIKKLKELNEMPINKTRGIDISDILGRFTLDSFIEICFGKSLGIVDCAPKRHLFSETFDESVIRCSYRFFDSLWKMKRFLGFEEEKKMKKNEKILNDFIYKLLDIETERQLTDESGVDKHDLISLYLSLEPNISKKELRDIALNMIIAGRDTTRVLLSWFFYAIENKPDILKKIKEDMDTIKGDDISYDEASNQLKYTQCVLLETLRLYPSVSYSWRRACKDVEIPGKNFTLRKGQVLNIHHFTMGRDKDIWGEDALIFNPMRWYDDLLNTKSPYEFVQFHVPPRMCLGRHFALLEAKIFLFYFFKHFDFEPLLRRPTSVDHNEDHKIIIPYSYGALMQMVDGYFLRLTDVKAKQEHSKSSVQS